MAIGSNREYTACPLCGQDQGSREFMIKGHTLIECRSCGLLYVRDRMCEDELHRFYGEHYFSSPDELNHGYSDYGEMGKDREKTFSRYLRRILPFLQGREQVLDIGCGYGYFLNAAEGHFRRLAGIDVSREALGKVNPAFEIRCGEFHSELYPPDFADLVMMSDFVEHLYHPVGFLTEVHKVLRPGGLLCLITPNCKSLFSRVSGTRWVSFKLPEHVCYYSPSSISRLLKVTGFYPVLISPCGQYASLEFIAKRLGQLIFMDGGAHLIPERVRQWSVYVNSGSMMVLARPNGLASRRERKPR